MTSNSTLSHYWSNRVTQHRCENFILLEFSVHSKFPFCDQSFFVEILSHITCCIIIITEYNYYRGNIETIVCVMNYSKAKHL